MRETKRRRDSFQERQAMSKYYSINDDSARIRDIQEMLRYIEKFGGEELLRIAPSGVYDEVTRDAVRKLQRQNSITETGITDERTFNLIKLEYDLLVSENSSPVPIDVFEGYTISPGEKSDIVCILQIMLNSLREKYDFIPLLPLSGSFNSDTASAIVSFKTAKGMPPTPEVDKLTWDALAREYNLTLRQ